jgi:hypothetical protein
MASIKPLQAFAANSDNRDGWIVTWSNMQNGDIGVAPTDLIGFADHTVQVEGTFGAGGTCQILGSLDNINNRQLTDPQGNLLNIVSPAIKQVTEACLYMIPKISSGDGTTNLTVTALFRRTKI